MLRERSAQRGLSGADLLYLSFLGEDSFYGFLARHRGELFRDEDFAECYSPDIGRPSVPPSLLATALLLQAHDKVSDEEAKARADYDLRWKVALGVDVDASPFAESTLQRFRVQMVLNETMRTVFERGLAYAREAGYLRKRELRIVLDTTNIPGRGAAKDTCDLLADGIGQLMRVLAEAEGMGVEEWGRGQGLERYLAPSTEGGADVDWDDEEARREFLDDIVTDAKRLLSVSGEARAQMPKDDEQGERIERAGALLRQLISQDVERCEEGSALK